MRTVAASASAWKKEYVALSASGRMSWLVTCTYDHNMSQICDHDMTQMSNPAIGVTLQVVWRAMRMSVVLRLHTVHGRTRPC